MERVNPTVLALGAIGFAALYFATRPERGEPKDRSGKKCGPNDPVPLGYICVEDGDGKGYHLEKIKKGTVNYSPYPGLKSVNEALVKLGFESGDLHSFQSHMSGISRYNLPITGEPSPETMQALCEAEDLLEHGRWRRP